MASQPKNQGSKVSSHEREARECRISLDVSVDSCWQYKALPHSEALKGCQDPDRGVELCLFVDTLAWSTL